MSLDENASEGCDYNIKSLYFDDYKNTALFEKLLGVKDRYKFRIRIYNNSSDIIKVEKKTKHGHLTRKYSTNISEDQFNKIMSNDFSFIGNEGDPVLLDFYGHVKSNCLSPKVIVDYDREAYTHKAGNVRITFDKRLKTGLNSIELLNKDIPLISSLDNNAIIMEIKYDEYFPSHLRSIVSLGNREVISNSKYVICRKYTKTNMWEEN